ncbi:MAG: protoporphyrinogen oxidase [Deltaproteobacteria bacterium]|nr:protoporphyrinogen oxidase [Deltaproteobacteria bacterium]
MGDRKSGVAIVGGGISALACAVALKERRIPFTIFEKEKSGGGKLRTESVGDFLIETGPDSFLPEKPWTVQLTKKIGLENEMLCSNDEHKGTYIFSGGRLHRLPEGVMLMVPTMILPMLRSPLISWPGKVRMGMDFVIPARKTGGDESLESFVGRRLGRECLDKIAEPLVAGIHTSSPDNMSVLATFPRFVEMEKSHGSLIRAMTAAMKKAPPRKPDARPMTYFMSMKRGMQQLSDGCVRFIGKENILDGVEIARIERLPAGYRLHLASSSLPPAACRLPPAFDVVVLATPSFVTTELVRELDPGLAGKLSAIEWSSSGNVSLAFRRIDLKNDLPGFGFIVPKVENRRLNAATWSSIKWAGRAPDDHVLVRAFVGGGHHEEMVSLPDDDLAAAVRQELSAIAGIDAKPVLERLYRWHRSMPKYTVGHLDRMAAIEADTGRHPGLHLIGCSYKGIGIGDCVKSGFDAADAIAGDAG